MSSLLTIHLEKIIFFAFHGLYELEKSNGNEFEFNLSASFYPATTAVKHINETINYITLYHIVKEEMEQPRELLEHFLSELAEKISCKYPEIISLKMSLYKLTVPIINFEGRVGVTLEKQYNNKLNIESLQI